MSEMATNDGTETTTTTITYAWRGEFESADVEALHGEGFGHDPVDYDWFGQVTRHSLGWVCAYREAKLVGNLLGTRTVLNELVAYTGLGAQKALLSSRSFTITTFALCGFANLSSIGIQIGGIGALAPSRRNDLARLGFRAMLAGTMANLMSASIVSMLIK